MELKDKNIWVVGGTHGIGEALVAQLATQNSVIVSGRSADSLHALENTNPNIKGLTLDVSNASSLQVALTEVKQTFGTIDMVIYGAGIYERGPFGTLKTDTLRAMIEVNLTAAVALVNDLVPILQKQNKGSIVLFGSVAGYSGLPNASAYGISKAGMLHMAEILKQDLKNTPIGIHVISPGFVNTRLTQKNTFHMPFMITPERAARYIITGLEKGVFEIHFPKQFTYILKFLRLLPYGLYFRLTRWLIKQ